MKTILKYWTCLTLILSLLLPCGCSPSERVDAGLTVRLLNTGKSDAILIFTADATILIDTADADDSQLIKNALNEAGREQIDLLILTHYDSDHVGSAAEIVRSFEVKVLIGPDYFRDSNEMSSLNKAMSAKKLTFDRLTADTEYTFGDLSLSVSVPELKSYEDKNDFSLITTLYYGNMKFLFLGDAHKVRLAEFYPVAESSYDLVKIPHHGDYTKELGKLFSKSTFSYAAICESEPEDASLTAMLQNYAVTFYRTYDGDITVTTDGEKMFVKQ